MKTVCIVLLVLCFALLSHGANYTWSGTVTVDQPMKFNETDILIILPGTNVYFLRNTSAITIAGLVFANGTEQAPIRFTRDPSWTDKGLHKGVTLDSNRVYNVFFSFCEFSYGTNGLYVHTSIYSSMPQYTGASVTNCTFQYNDVGLYVYWYSLATVKGSLFQYNKVVGVQTAVNSAILLYDSTITKNGGHGVGVESSNYGNITNCLIAHNLGQGVYADGKYAMFNSTVTNNTMGGVNAHYSGVVVQYNNIYDNLAFQFKLLYAAPNYIYLADYNYWGTTNKTLLAQWIPSSMTDPALPDITYSPVFSQRVETCATCLVDVTIPFPQGYIASNTTWTLASSPYTFNYDVVVLRKFSLTIEPGVVVQFAPGRQLIADGDFISVGTPIQPITFTANSVGNTSATWRKVTIRSASLTMAYTIFEKLDTGVYLSLPTYNPPAVITGCTFRSSSMDGLVIGSSVRLNISDSIFEQNVRAGIYIDSSGSSSVTNIENSVIADNAYGVYFGWSGMTFRVYNSTITRSTSAAFYTSYSQQTLELYFSKIIRNRQVAFENFGPTVSMSFCDFYDNYRAPKRNFPVVVLSYRNLTYLFRQNYYGDSDECFLSQLTTPFVFPTANTTILEGNSVLTSPFDLACERTAINNASCPITIITPTPGLKYDACGVCNGDNSTCRTGCNALNPYRCQDKSCIDVPTLCPSPITSACFNKNKRCWDGSCVNSTTSCPTFPRCHPSLPKRCADGSCVGISATCPTPFRCAPPKQSCPDGSCASDCLAYDGCAIGFSQCADGSCTNSTCPTGACASGESLCADSSCAVTCPRPIWYEWPAPMNFTSQGVIINNVTGVRIATVTNYKFGTTLVQRRPDSYLRSVASPWAGMGFEQAVKSPVLWFSSRSSDVLIRIVLAAPNLSPAYNYCLGYVNETMNMWQCDSSLDKQSDGSYVSSIISFGTYAILVDNGEMGTLRNNTGIFPTPAPSTPRPPTSSSSSFASTTGDQNSSAPFLFVSLALLFFCVFFSL